MKRLFSLLIFIFFIAGCIEENIVPEDFEYYDSADLISFAEINNREYYSGRNSFLISVDELYENLKQYLILDIRNDGDFLNGHIEGAINIPIGNLFDYFESHNNLDYEKIIIISSTGQRAAYAVSLLRLYNHYNVFSLDFGMGQWNREYSSPWLQARSDSRYKSQLYLLDNPKPKLIKELPVIPVPNSEIAVDTLLNIRIRELLSNQSYIESLTNIEELEAYYSLIHRTFENAFIICFGDRELYEIQQIIKDIEPGPIIYGGHPRNSILFTSMEEFKSSEYLLSLPVNTRIYIYSYNGQEGAYLNAYLNLLGYNSKNIIYGGVSMFYYYMKFNRFSESFRVSEIRDYPFVK